MAFVFLEFYLVITQVLSNPFVVGKRLHQTETTQLVTENILVYFNESQYNIGPKFLSVTLGASETKNRSRGLDFNSSKVQSMARALSPAYVRVGGTEADFLIFNSGTKKTVNPPFSSAVLNDQLFTMTGEEWQTITRFFEVADWNVIFDLNIFLRKNGSWNPQNAESLLQFSDVNGINISAFQLGNEPNAYKHIFNLTIPPADLLNDFKILRKQLNKHSRLKASSLFGPDVTGLSEHFESSAYFEGYYTDGRTATLDDFLSVQILDSLTENFAIARSILGQSSCQLPLALSETSSCFNGGAPGLSDRFVAGFLWLDKLGLSALYGLSHVFRHTFFGGSYSLISNELEPRPDFYLSVLFKKLVAGPVLTIERQPDKIRVYANCASTALYPPGAVVVYLLNLRNTTASLSLSQFVDSTIDIYLRTLGDSDGLLS
ncbi:hypothetical protein Btru_030058, partial [Bulinus truncatus]